MGMTHTPGPYVVGKPGGPAGPFWSVINQDGNVVAMQITTNDNARLISAAPDLLLSCMEMWGAIVRIERGWDTADMQTECLDRARAAITKALGEWPLDNAEVLGGPNE